MIVAAALWEQVLVLFWVGFGLVGAWVSIRWVCRRLGRRS